MSPVRLGAVSYLNTKPLVHGLEEQSALFSLRFDVPAQCAALLHEGRVDLGLIPAIEYLRGDYRIVPGVAIGSKGAIASVAIFSRVPVDKVTTLALDISSRTSVALTRILCARRWHIAPKVTPAEPDLRAMLTRADAALIIGDPALATTKVIVLTTFELDEYVFGALRAGASGFLLKDIEPAALIDAVRLVHDGQALLAPQVTRRLIEAYVASVNTPADLGVTLVADPRLAALTPREREVLVLVGQGMSNQEIAEALVLSPLTAKTHVSRLFLKLGARDRAQLVVIAYELGLVGR